MSSAMITNRHPTEWLRAMREIEAEGARRLCIHFARQASHRLIELRQARDRKQREG